MFLGRENVLYLINTSKVDLDKNIALEYLGNNVSLYNKLIREYVNNYKTLDNDTTIIVHLINFFSEEWHKWM